ncbi:MAG: hypothetical protein EZS28_001828 [Streblomastix strix]|uniref:Uncharacterized protein n=1 Tax=Streblomastix strix TaxID=222440 RepID=A0A5J4X603_9EUKA|nr:MAG: hypothetical protein EZS28_001828 [Streblomastix strix]
MLAWKLETDDSFMRGYNSSKMGARTNIQVTLQGNLTTGIVDSSLIMDAVQDNQINLVEFFATRAYPTPTNAQITPQMHYLCVAIIRFTFDDAPDPQVLNFEIIGEIGGTMGLVSDAKRRLTVSEFPTTSYCTYPCAPIRFYLQHIFEKPYPPIPQRVIPYNQFETVMINI